MAECEKDKVIPKITLDKHEIQIIGPIPTIDAKPDLELWFAEVAFETDENNVKVDIRPNSCKYISIQSVH